MSTAFISAWVIFGPGGSGVCTFRRSVGAASFPSAVRTGGAWKSLPFLKGGSVATRSTVSESMPRRMGRLSQWNSVRFWKLGAVIYSTLYRLFPRCQLPLH